jgi:hypothetical protein
MSKPLFCLVFKSGWREGHRFPAKSDGGGVHTPSRKRSTTSWAEKATDGAVWLEFDVESTRRGPSESWSGGTWMNDSSPVPTQDNLNIYLFILTVKTLAPNSKTRFTLGRAGDLMREVGIPYSGAAYLAVRHSKHVFVRRD